MRDMIFDLQIFANPNTQTTLLDTSGNDLSPEMKTYYEKRLIDHAEPSLVHDQFGDPYPIPPHGGKTIEFRKYSPLDKALDKLTEGVTPDGNTLDVSTVTATVDQYGDYITISDVLELTAIDRNIEQATKLLGGQAGRTLDTVTRDIITAGTNRLFAPTVSGGTPTEVLLRENLNETALLTVDVIFKAVAKLREQNAMPIDDMFVGIVHPNVACDLMLSDKWVDVHKYAQPENIYRGEIGSIGGVRFVQTTEAKIIVPAAISDGLNKLTVKTAIAASTTSVVIKEVLTAATPTVPIKVYIDGTPNTITAIATSAGETTLTVGTAITTLAADKLIYGTGAGKKGESVYFTMVLGANSYGTTDVTGGGLQYIVKQAGSAGSADPLNQRATTGWKALKTAERLVEQYMVRVEHCSATNLRAAAN